ncbi:alpha/beta hydrolase [Streptomyces sp. MJP52]|uniref:alpha/beta fold hydrolase n=1 Tax=Streptomyces sp. MJP52 TaxID=2940555 RepID=UPI002476A268|nr:alpha/beta hydrolase [Streptomyces sp. MJP52]MDH6224286.1 pimeloyl-ACP methyl ester carboxylesterase [Streptomyces sp. MJP52]
MERTIQKKLSVGGESWITVDVYGEPGTAGLVVVPGVMSDAYAWRRVAGAVTAWPSVVVVNRRGRTPSGPLTDSYSLRTEVEDLCVVLDEFAGTRALFGWSYGGLIALLAADERPVHQVIAYEPVVRPFGLHALPDLKAAQETADWDRCVEIVNRRISGFSAAHVEGLRADHDGWAVLRRLSGPLCTELGALNATPPPDVMARRADRADLIIGGRNRGTAPYGTSFDDVRRRVARAGVHELPGQGHLAHIQAPAALGRLLDTLAAG